MTNTETYCPNCKTRKKTLVLEGEYIGFLYCPKCRTIDKDTVDWIKKRFKEKEIKSNYLEMAKAVQIDIIKDPFHSFLNKKCTCPYCNKNIMLYTEEDKQKAKEQANETD